jgi:hypothetical protein
VQEPKWRPISLELLSWIGETSFPTGPPLEAALSRPAQRNLSTEGLVSHIARLLNEWLPTEVAHLLMEPGGASLDDSGIPVLAVARGVERLLVREHLAAPTLEEMLHPGLLSPMIVYPADLEILWDVVLFLLGRTELRELPILPANELCVAPAFPRGNDYKEAVGRAHLANVSGSEELHVPIAEVQAKELLKSDRVSLGSILITMDGRWWRAARLHEDGDRYLVVHRPGGRLEIEYSGGHTRVQIPWPEGRSCCGGLAKLGATFEIFGRQWRAERWERDWEQTRLHLVFLRMLPTCQIVPGGAGEMRRSRPAGVDMAWTSLENALANWTATSAWDAVEQLRHAELIPIGRALCALVECVMDDRLRNRDSMATRTASIRFLQTELAPVYGRVPWRILPEPVRKRLLGSRSNRDLLVPVFEGFPSAVGNDD